MDSIRILANKEEITPIADEIRRLNGITELMDLNTMTNNLDEANNEINTQTTKLNELKTILQGKATNDSGNNIDTCSVRLYSDDPKMEVDWYVYERVKDGTAALTLVNKYEQGAFDIIINDMKCGGILAYDIYHPFGVWIDSTENAEQEAGSDNHIDFMRINAPPGGMASIKLRNDD